MKYPQLVSMPSAVSDWLEEQLEARGIDAVVYTRYVLSLLHTHTVDVIYSDEDLQFSRLTKEVRRSSGSRKRFRRSSDWWRHAQADAEQIKRSAAVECLMSASDQNCEIESLVDELCEKMKEVNNEPSLPPKQEDSTPTTAKKLEEPVKSKDTPKDLAEKYYAAFPPLCPITLAEIAPSPKSKKKPVNSPIKKNNNRKPNNRQATRENKLFFNGEMTKTRNPNKPRLNYLNRNANHICRKNKGKGNCAAQKKERCASSKRSEPPGNAVNIQEALDQCTANNEYWTNEDDELKMYDDLPVDIQDLLDSPCPRENTVEMMNISNMRDDGKRNFIPFGTNITSSIWSNDNNTNFDNRYNAFVESTGSESNLNSKFSSITIDNRNAEVSWSFQTPTAENAPVLFEENHGRNVLLEGFHSLPEEWAAGKEECFENENLLNHVAVSLMKLNHTKGTSSFAEIFPGFKPLAQPFNPFSREKSLFNFDSKRAIGFERDKKEDLLTSDRTHFRPINEKLDNYTQGEYADGATFMISNSLDKVEYKRSESGSMLLEMEFGQYRKYQEYRLGDLTRSSPELEFVLKFKICQNDKACQTEELSESDFKNAVEAGGEPKSDDVEEFFEERRYTCPAYKAYSYFSDSVPKIYLGHPAESESRQADSLWKYDTKICEKCNGSNVAWNPDSLKYGQMNSKWDSEGLKNIWSIGEVCDRCLKLNDAESRLPPSTQLLKDVRRDGEQLLSYLNTVQKSYMEELPLTELSCDINEMVSAINPKERKRRHSFINAHTDESGLDDWSFATLLEEDCLIQMSTLSAMRSVTL